MGGGENYLREISERFVANGQQVTVATSDADQAELFWNPAKRRLAQREAEHGGVCIRRFPLRHLPLAPLSYSVWRYLIFWFLASRPGLPVAWLTRLARFTPWTPELWRWIDSGSEKFDIVGAMGILYEPFVAAARRAATLWQVPFIVYPLTHLGASPKPGQDRVSRYYTMRHQIALVRAADKVVVMTPTEGQFYEDQGVAAERIQVAGAGVNPTAVQGGNAERFRSQNNLRSPLVAFLSAMAHDKGTPHLVEAMRRLWAAGRSAELVLAGTLLDPFRRYLQQLPAADRERICLLNSISESDKQDLLAAADIVAMPSRTDSFGIIYLEAWLYRKPVIGAQAWGVSDVIRNGEDGLLVPFGDVEALAQAIATLLDQPDLRARLGERGQQKVLAQYTWDKVYGRIAPLYGL
jgi:glycosyltransferase involved in cell wall biosynthesis